jgi:hypothetical protein
VIGVDGMDDARWRAGGSVSVVLWSVPVQYQFESIVDGKVTVCGGAEEGISTTSARRDTGSARPSKEYWDESRPSSSEDLEDSALRQS